MAIRADWVHAMQIARSELRRELRTYTNDRRRLLGLVFTVGFYLLVLASAIPMAYTVGARAGSLDSIPFLGVVMTVLPIGAVGMMALQAANRIAQIEASDLVLTIVHPRAAVLGLLGTECVHQLCWFGLPVGAVGLAFVAGAGHVSVVLTGGTLLVGLGCWAAVWGYTAAIWVLRLFQHRPTVKRVLKALSTVSIVAIVLVSQQLGRWIGGDGGTGRSFEQLLQPFVFEPLRSYGTLAFIGTPIGGSPSLAGVAVLGVFVITTPLGVRAATRQATAYWFRDPPPDTHSTEQHSAGGFEPPWPFERTLTGQLAWGHLVRAKRKPQRLAHLQSFVVLLAMLVPTLWSIGLSGPLLAGGAVITATWLAGGLFCANPLGDDRPMGTLLFVTAPTADRLVQSRAFAGLIVAVPVAVCGPLLTIVLGTPLPAAIGFAVLGTVLCVSATGLALGLGAFYPIFEKRDVFGTEAVSPSIGVLQGYQIVVLGGTVIGLGGTWTITTGGLAFGWQVALGLVLYLVVTLAIPYAGYRYAIRRYEALTIGGVSH